MEAEKTKNKEKPLILKIPAKVAFILALAAPLAVKMCYINNLISSYTGVRFLGAAQVIANDALIYFMILLLLYISFLNKTPFILSIMLRVAALFVFVLYIADLTIIINFNTHLTITDTVKYASYLNKYVRQILNFKLLFSLLFFLVAFIFTIPFLISKYKIKNKATYAFFISALLCLLLASRFVDNDRYVHSWLYENFFDYNRTCLSKSKKYSNAFIKDFHFKDKEFSCSKKPEKPDIILLMVESLSSYQSKFFSGIENWTPNLDSIAKKNVAYKNFYSNGFCTEDAFVSLLTGCLPIARPGLNKTPGSTSFNKLYNCKNSLPNILKRAGYSTEFFVSSDLGFANEGPWLKSLGFDYVEGSENPYYNNWERFQFDAPPDKALFNRVLDRVEEKEKKKNPYFIFICTVTSHHPYINPETKNHSESEVFQYVDKQIGVFYRKLLASGFFANGVLIIVGDHRAMIPLREEEINRFGSKACAQIPMIISYGDKKHSVINEQYQQVDIYNGLKNLISNIESHSDWTGDIFSQKPPKYIAHKRGDSRDIISVFSNDKDWSVKLDGDNTRIMNNNSTDMKTGDSIVKKINAVRILHSGT